MTTTSNGSTWAQQDGAASPSTLSDLKQAYELAPGEVDSSSFNQGNSTSVMRDGLAGKDGKQFDQLSNSQSSSQSTVVETDDVARISCSWPTCSMVFPRLSERDRHYKTEHANNRQRPYKCEVKGCQANVTSWAGPGGLRRHNKQWHGPYHCQAVDCPRGFPCGFSTQNGLDDHIREVHESKSLEDGRGPSQATSIIQDTVSDTVEQDISSDSTSTIPSYPVPAIGVAEPSYSASEDSTIERQLHNSAPIVTRDPTTSFQTQERRKRHSPLSTADYKGHESRKFEFGKVFKVLWSEPLGSGGTVITSSVSLNQAGFAKIRRFLVVDNRRGHCLCVPILTYGNQATLKRGVHSEDHAIIYTDRDKGPLLMPGEVLSKAALRMEPLNSSHKLDPASRVNYAKVYTVEHNVKVQFIGSLARNSQVQFVADYNRVHSPIQPVAPESGFKIQSANEQQPFSLKPALTTVEHHTEPISSGPETAYTHSSAQLLAPGYTTSIPVVGFQHLEANHASPRNSSAGIDTDQDTQPA